MSCGLVTCMGAGRTLRQSSVSVLWPGPLNPHYLVPMLQPLNSAWTHVFEQLKQGIYCIALKHVKSFLCLFILAALLIINLFGHWVSFDHNVLKAWLILPPL